MLIAEVTSLIKKKSRIENQPKEKAGKYFFEAKTKQIKL